MEYLDPIFVSYYTIDTPYEQVIKKYLLPSLEKWNLKHHLQAVLDLGSWQANTSFKASFILEMLNTYKRPVVFLDADASIEEYPNLFFEIDNDRDLAIAMLDWNLQWRGKPGNKFELLSGTIMFNYNHKVLNLVKEWNRQCATQTGTWEQKILQRVIDETPNLKLYLLPKEYFAIVLYNGQVPKYISKPVIIHHQASRLYKNRLKRRPQ